MSQSQETSCYSFKCYFQQNEFGIINFQQYQTIITLFFLKLIFIRLLLLEQITVRFIYIVVYIMKNRGAKSTQLFKNKQILQQKLEELTQASNETSRQLISLKSKITQSKPLLETIHTKVKIKETYLQERISENQKRLLNAELKVKRNLDLHQKTLRTIKEIGVDKMYTGNHNYPVSSMKNMPVSKIIEEFTKHKEKKRYQKQIIPSQPPESIKPDDAYQNYQQKLKNARNSNWATQNYKALKQRALKLARNIQLGIQNIKKVRKQFSSKQKNKQLQQYERPRKSKSQIRLKHHYLESQQQRHIDLQKAQRFLLNKQKRLHQLRSNQ